MTKYTQYHIIDTNNNTIQQADSLDAARRELEYWYKYGYYTDEYIMSMKIKRVTFVEVEESSVILNGLLEAPK